MLEDKFSDDSLLSDDANLEDEDLDEGVINGDDGDDEDEDDNNSEPEEDDDDDDEGDANVEKDEEGEEDDDSNTPNQTKPLFDKKQQTEVDRIIKSRLERQEATLIKGLSTAAGTTIDKAEATEAARLWGLLKLNPDLSNDIGILIDDALSNGRATAPDDGKSISAVEQRLELKEAILDLKAEDRVFNKNADKIMAWADAEGYEVTNSKALRLAYLAWKGSQGKVEELVQKTTAQRKQTAKQSMQKKASVQSTKSGKPSTGTPQYNKMSDTDVLATEGLSLFTED